MRILLALTSTLRQWAARPAVTVALVAGMTAAATVGMGKPVAVLLIMLLLAGASAPGALCAGALVGYGAARLLPARAGH